MSYHVRSAAVAADGHAIVQRPHEELEAPWQREEGGTSAVDVGGYREVAEEEAYEEAGLIGEVQSLYQEFGINFGKFKLSDQNFDLICKSIKTY